MQFHFIDVLCNEFQLIDLRNRQAYEQRKDQLQLATTYTNAAEIDDIETLVINQLQVQRRVNDFDYKKEARKYCNSAT